MACLNMQRILRHVCESDVFVSGGVLLPCRVPDFDRRGGDAYQTGSR